MIKNENGFTLVELLVSISIIAILTVLASISYSNAQKNGRDQRRIEDLKAIQNAAEQYYLLSGGSYLAAGNYSSGASSWKFNTQIVLQKYPKDPKGVEYSVAPNPITSVNGGYCVCATMENVKNANSNNLCGDFVNVTDQFCVKNQQ
ncbi:MAG: type II secretion system protein [Candidatus Shapirobacteria bacterium]|nr:type II secretion system protein [Candidatus Shapirobacteria bacterium]